MGPKARGRGDAPEDKVRKRGAWLSAHVFQDRPIDDEAVAAMVGMGIARAMELFRELEEKADRVRNPSGYLKNAARREGFGPPDEQGKAGGKGNSGGNTDPGKVRKRVQWLNANVFVDNPIDDAAMESMMEIDVSRAMEIFKDAEAKADSLHNPSSYLRVASNRAKERSGLALAISTQTPAKSAGKGAAGKVSDHEKIDKRAAWLNKNVFASSPIDDEAIAAMKGMGAPRAMELFKEIEEKQGQLRNPSMYLKKAAMREGFGPPGAPPPRAAAASAGGKASGKASGDKPGGGAGRAGGHDAQRVQKRVDWLNKHSFTANPIDEDAAAAMVELGVPRAMEIFKELEGKAGEIKNPSAYLIGALRKEGRGAKRPRAVGKPEAAAAAPLKRAKVEESA